MEKILRGLETATKSRPTYVLQEIQNDQSVIQPEELVAIWDVLKSSVCKGKFELEKTVDQGKERWGLDQISGC